LLCPSELQGRTLRAAKSGPSLRSGFRQRAPGFFSMRHVRLESEGVDALTTAGVDASATFGGASSIHPSYRDGHTIVPQPPGL
jgi:hypothetical protein